MVNLRKADPVWSRIKLFQNETKDVQDVSGFPGIDDSRGPERAESITVGNVSTGGGDFIGRDRIVKGDEIHGDQIINLRPEQFTPRQRRIREGLITRVRTVWVEGILEHGIHRVARLELGLELRPDAVSRPWVLEYEKPERPAQELPPDTTAYDIWMQTGGSLLILGAPGAGKTFTLVELAEKLLDEAAQDENQPVPVIFNLSSWALEKGALFDWLVREMHLVYGVALKYSPEWLAEMPYALFLDGLDEVAAGDRDACVEAIHAFQAEYGPMPVVVCSRTQEYGEMAKRLQVEGAVHMRSLSKEQVDAYLVAGGEELAAARMAVKTDALLRELAETPLMLNVIALAYWDRPVGELASGTLTERRRALFEAYVERMFERKGEMPAEEQEKSRSRLAYLAQQMEAHEQSLFYVERLQANWLSGQGRILYSLLLFATFGLLFGLFAEIAYRQADTGLLRIIFWILGLATGLHGVLVEIEPVDELIFSWKRGIRKSIEEPRIKLTASIVGGLLAGLVAGVANGLVVGLITGLVLSIFSSLIFFLLDGLESAFITQRLPTYTIPRQGLSLSLRNSIIAGLTVGLIAGLAAGLFFVLLGGLLGDANSGLAIGLKYFLQTGLMVSLLFGFLPYGGTAVIKHTLLRLLLAYSDRLPLHLIPFLEAMHRRILLRRVGGGYMFIHRMLQEYFAELYIEAE